jgi:hypothetical protein
MIGFFDDRASYTGPALLFVTKVRGPSDPRQLGNNNKSGFYDGNNNFVISLFTTNI